VGRGKGREGEGRKGRRGAGNEGQGEESWNRAADGLRPALTKRFEIPDPQTPKTAKICPILVGTKFSLDFAFNIGVSGVNTPYSSSELTKSVIVNRQCGVIN